MKKIVLAITMTTAFLFVMTGCGTSGTYKCVDSQASGNCSSVQTCCTTSGTCYYKADGKRFDCAGVGDCTNAAQDVVNYCAGVSSDIINNNDTGGLSDATASGTCAEAKQCCISIGMAGMKCDTFDTQDEATCKTMLDGWKKSGECK